MLNQFAQIRSEVHADHVLKNSAFRASTYETPYEDGGTIARDQVVSRNRPAGAVATDNRARDPIVCIVDSYALMPR